MSALLRVLLLEKVESLGVAGELVSVTEGYARNFLFPEGKAVIATESTEKQKAQADAKQKKESEAKLQELQTLAETLEKTELTLTAKLKDGDEIFGSIGAKQIASELKSKAKLTLKPKDIELPEPITRTGTHTVTLNLSPDVAATLRVTVMAEPSDKPADDEE